VGRSRLFGCFVAVFVALGSACAAPGQPGGGAPGAGGGGAPAGVPTVVVYGDSLTWESQSYIPGLAAEKGVQVTQHSFVATAVCDWFPDMWKRLPQERPDVVVFAFFGNSWTPCMRDGHGGWYQGADKAKKYARDTEAATAIALASGAKVVLVGAPRSRDQMSDPQWDGVRDAYRAIARRHPARVSFRDAGEDIAPDQTYAATQPCLPRERAMVERDGNRPCHNGRIIVRAPDGLHFCPHGLDNAIGQPGHCPRYMSGGYRYIRTLLDAAWQSLDVSATTLPRAFDITAR
jgi:hypothetical protein